MFSPLRFGSENHKCADRQSLCACNNTSREPEFVKFSRLSPDGSAIAAAKEASNVVEIIRMTGEGMGDRTYYSENTNTRQLGC